jgi:hypothetical protein
LTFCFWLFGQFLTVCFACTHFLSQ